MENEHQFKLVNRTCPFCGKKSRLAVDAEAFRKWNNGALAQDVFGDLPPEQRELIMTGMCLRCQEAVFNEDD